MTDIFISFTIYYIRTYNNFIHILNMRNNKVGVDTDIDFCQDVT